MRIRLLKPAVLAAFVTIFSAPAIAQVRVELPSVEIRIGHTAPPPLRYESRPHRPGSEYVWLAGAWDWRSTGWAWEPGRWDRPAYHGARWNKARYVREGSAWRYEPGHWKNQRLVEGDDYRRWKAEQHDRDRDHR